MECGGGSECWSGGVLEGPARHLQMESCNKISTATCQKSRQIFFSGQDSLFFLICYGFQQIQWKEGQAVRRVFEDGHVLELLGSQLMEDVLDFQIFIYAFFIGMESEKGKRQIENMQQLEVSLHLKWRALTSAFLIEAGEPYQWFLNIASISLSGFYSKCWDWKYIVVFS